MSQEIARKIIEDAGGKVVEISGPLPDGSGIMIGSFPLPKDHWIYSGHDEPPMVFKMEGNERAMLIIGESDDPNDAGLPIALGRTMTRQGFAEQIRIAGRYAIQASTMDGKYMDFDPDAMLINLVNAFLGNGFEMPAVATVTEGKGPVIV